MLRQIESKPIHIILPKSHLGSLVAGYLYQMEILDKDQKIVEMNIPIDADEEGNIEITIGILKESIN